MGMVAEAKNVRSCMKQHADVPNLTSPDLVSTPSPRRVSSCKIKAGLLTCESSSGHLPGLLASGCIALCHRLQRRVRGGFAPHFPIKPVWAPLIIYYASANQQQNMLYSAT